MCIASNHPIIDQYEQADEREKKNQERPSLWDITRLRGDRWTIFFITWFQLFQVHFPQGNGQRFSFVLLNSASLAKLQIYNSAAYHHRDDYW